MIIQYGKEPFKISEHQFWIHEKRESVYWLDDFGKKGRLKILVRDPRDLTGVESVEGLWHSEGVEEGLDPILMRLIQENRVFRINTAHKDFEKWLVETQKKDFEEPYFKEGQCLSSNETGDKRIHILGLGDVGSTMALALCLYGKGSISEIGIYDLDENRVNRWEQELNQIAEPLQDKLPKVVPIEKKDLFNCDLFAFTASVGVPPISVTEGDVRMVQFEGNSKLVGEYAQLAVQADFKGIFAIVSDPVDQLCRYAFDVTHTDDQGHWQSQGLNPEQIRGYGLGVMNGRAAYYAKLEGVDFNPNGRVYGPHGKGLVVANDWRKGYYNAQRSNRWTEQTMTANLRIREMGYKPYIAPAVASGAISLVKTLTGEKHYSCISFDGFYYGCLNQHIRGMDFYERLDSAPELIEKIKASVEEMNTQWQKSR